MFTTTFMAYYTFYFYVVMAFSKHKNLESFYIIFMIKNGFIRKHFNAVKLIVVISDNVHFIFYWFKLILTAATN